jgi:hypothetical protein
MAKPRSGAKTCQTKDWSMSLHIQLPPEPEFAELISPHEWRTYAQIIEAAEARRVPIAVGGGLAFSAYSQRWRSTKDIDFYIFHKDVEEMIDIVHGAGFQDYFEKLPYDRRWIYRAHRDGIIVDLIWSMANYLAETDADWLSGGADFQVSGTTVKLLPIEELIWAKQYLLQRDRCDWPDLLNLIYVRAAQIDWERLLRRVGPDARLLGGVLSVFSWMCPERVQAIPEWVWQRLGLLRPAECDQPPSAPEGGRAALLDRRPWFGPGIEHRA